MDAAERERLILERLPQVQLIARLIRRPLTPEHTLDDLISEGVLGLIAAVDRFDPARNLKLQTYAEYKIRGAILDYLRRCDWGARARRSAVRRGKDPGPAPQLLSLDSLREWAN